MIEGLTSGSQFFQVIQWFTSRVLEHFPGVDRINDIRW
jgi:hypothetical protein